MDKAIKIKNNITRCSSLFLLCKDMLCFYRIPKLWRKILFDFTPFSYYNTNYITHL